MAKKGCGSCKGSKSSAMAKAMASHNPGTGFPTLADLKKTVPKGGLLNPDLRKGFGITVPKKK